MKEVKKLPDEKVEKLKELLEEMWDLLEDEPYFIAHGFDMTIMPHGYIDLKAMDSGFDWSKLTPDGEWHKWEDDNGVLIV